MLPVFELAFPGEMLKGYYLALLRWLMGIVFGVHGGFCVVFVIGLENPCCMMFNRTAGVFLVIFSY